MENLKGKTLLYVNAEGDGLTFITDDYTMYSLCGDDGYPNDCEVWIESIVGDLHDLVGYPLLIAQEVESVDNYKLDMSLEKNAKHADYNQTWTFYKFATIKGYVDVRFCGESNGYYSEKAFLYNLGNVNQKYIDDKNNGVKS